METFYAAKIRSCSSILYDFIQWKLLIYYIYRHVLLLLPSKAVRFWCYRWFVISKMNCMAHKFWYDLQLRNNDCCLSSFCRITANQRTTIDGFLIQPTLLIVLLMLVTPTTLVNKLFLFTMVSFDLTRTMNCNSSNLKAILWTFVHEKNIFLHFCHLSTNLTIIFECI